MFHEHTVCVVGIPKAITLAGLVQLFLPYGRVVDARLISQPGDTIMGNTVMGVVTMSCASEVDEILTTRDRLHVHGLKPHVWRPKASHG